MPNLANPRAVLLRSGNDPSIHPKTWHHGLTLVSSQLLGESLGNTDVESQTLQVLQWKKASVWMDSPFLGDLAAPCLHCPGEGTCGDPRSRTPAHPPFRGQGHPTRDDVQRPPLCTAPAPGETWPPGVEEDFWQCCCSQCYPVAWKGSLRLEIPPAGLRGAQGEGSGVAQPLWSCLRQH